MIYRGLLDQNAFDAINWQLGVMLGDSDRNKHPFLTQYLLYQSDNSLAGTIGSFIQYIY